MLPDGPLGDKECSASIEVEGATTGAGVGATTGVGVGAATGAGEGATSPEAGGAFDEKCATAMGRAVKGCEASRFAT